MSYKHSFQDMEQHKDLSKLDSLYDAFILVCSVCKSPITQISFPTCKIEGDFEVINKCTGCGEIEGDTILKINN